MPPLAVSVVVDTNNNYTVPETVVSADNNNSPIKSPLRRERRVQQRTTTSPKPETTHSAPENVVSADNNDNNNNSPKKSPLRRERRVQMTDKSPLRRERRVQTATTDKSPLRRERRMPTTTTTSPKAPELSSPSPEQPRKVHFRRRVEIKKIRTLKSISEDEREAIYWTRNEFIAIRMKLVTELQQIITNEIMREDDDEPVEDDESCCARGLEGQTPLGAKVRKVNKRAIRKLVLKEQKRQQDGGVSDPDSIAFLCMVQAHDSVQAAIVVGTNDAMVAHAFHDDADALLQ